MSLFFLQKLQNENNFLAASHPSHWFCTELLRTRCLGRVQKIFWRAELIFFYRQIYQQSKWRKQGIEKSVDKRGIWQIGSKSMAAELYSEQSRLSRFQQSLMPRVHGSSRVWVVESNRTGHSGVTTGRRCIMQSADFHICPPIFLCPH